MRVDAQRNRERLLATAAELFREHGLEVGVAEIAESAGLGRGTLFRNFPTKDDLIAAVVIEQMDEALSAGLELLDGGPDDEAVFTFIADAVGRQHANRSVLEGLSDEFLARADVHDCHVRFLGVMAQLLERGKQAGSVRPEVVAFDVMMLMKGICLTTGALSTEDPEVLQRHLDLVRAAISTPGYARPLAGRALTLEDFAAASDRFARPR